MTPPPTSNGELIARLDEIKSQLGQLQIATEDTRRSTSAALQSLAVQSHRVEALEKAGDHRNNQIEAVERNIEHLRISLERLETTVKIMAGAGGTVATAGGAWIVAQLLGLIK